MPRGQHLKQQRLVARVKQLERKEWRKGSCVKARKVLTYQKRCEQKQDEVKTPKTLPPALLSQIRVDQQSQKSPNGRRYIKEDRERALLATLTSRAEYRVRLQNQCAISLSTIYQTKVELMKNVFKNRQLVGSPYDNLAVDLRLYRSRMGVKYDTNIKVVFQVDACALASNPKIDDLGHIKNAEIVKNDKGQKEIRPYTYGYAIYMVPRDPKYKAELLYVMLSPQGTGDKRIFGILEKVKEIVEKQYFTVQAVISDGDSQYVGMYSKAETTSVIKNYRKYVLKHKYSQIYHSFTRNTKASRKMTWLHDLIHVSKNIRSRALSNTMSLNPRRKDLTFNFNQLNKLSKFKNTQILDSHKSFSQNDQFPLEIFNGSTLAAIRQSSVGHSLKANYIYILLNIVTQLSFIEFTQYGLEKYLIFLLEFFTNYYEYVFEGIRWDEFGKPQINQTSHNGATVLPYNRQQVEAIILYIAYLLRMIDENETFSFLLITSYRIELYFAHLRQVCKNNDTPDNINLKIENDYLRVLLEHKYKVTNNTTRNGNKRSMVFHSTNKDERVTKNDMLHSIEMGRILFYYILDEKYQQSLTAHEIPRDKLFSTILSFVDELGIETWNIVAGRVHKRNAADVIKTKSGNSVNRIGRIVIASKNSQKRIILKDLKLNERKK
ncbi:Conserved_hypothetical protein [Hexamita inflata]|uniref:Uncharacterized protein n=1 Tax=Hexamita inflata TaxID=28002 RepID=A0AA86PP59_9EUKA|nr:Conserved hypothetical protein [Hexamita inflata]